MGGAGDTDSLAAALRAVLGDPARGAAIVEAGHGRLDHYSWDRTAAGVVQLYRRAADGLVNGAGADPGLP